jgi:hypothetical protein
LQPDHVERACRAALSAKAASAALNAQFAAEGLPPFAARLRPFENVLLHSSSGNALVMTARKRRKTVPLPMMMSDLMMASWETIARRTLLVARNKCSSAEYQRMFREKAMAAAIWT